MSGCRSLNSVDCGKIKIFSIFKGTIRGKGNGGARGGAGRCVEWMRNGSDSVATSGNKLYYNEVIEPRP